MTRQELRYCEGCRYLATGRTIEMTFCDYCDQVGHMRGCPAGPGCPYREKGKRARVQPRCGFKPGNVPPNKRLFDEAGVRLLWMAGKNDREIGKIYNVAPSTVKNLRQKLGLTHKRKGIKDDKAE